MIFNSGGIEQMPTEWEQHVAEIYVNERKLERPNTNIKTALLFVSMFMLVTGASVWFIHFALTNVGILAFLPPRKNPPPRT